MTQRTLRSKKLRATLYYSQGGQCAMCGCELPDEWHADHIIPHSISHRTNVHEMQALCPLCNLKKGNKMLRKHQRLMKELAIHMRANPGQIKDIFVHVTPGGGKSALPTILAAELAEKRNLKICWVVPRHALREQGERGFTDPKMRALTGHAGQVRASKNDINPSRGTGGYVTTYQSIAQNPELHLQEFKRHEYILFLDECHHVPFKGEGNGEEAAYYAALSPLVECAVLRVYASGTPLRHDGNKIAFLPYERNTNAEVISRKPPEGWAYIRYSRADALIEKAIVPLHFHLMNGHAEWFHPKNGTRSVDSIAESSKRDTREILTTVLRTEYAQNLLDQCAASWTAYKEKVYKPAKMLVVAPWIGVAREYCQYLQRQGFQALIATSDDIDEAHFNIDKFKKDADILVTVGMAAEGLDVPQITHVACLTNIRSRPYIEQCICRANRTDGNKEKGMIFYPDEPLMKAIMDEIESEQVGAVITFPPKAPTTRSDEWCKDEGEERSSIAPLSSGVTTVRGQGLEGTRIGYQESYMLMNAAEKAGLSHLSLVELKIFADELGWQAAPDISLPSFPGRTQTPSEHEKRLREAIRAEVDRIVNGDNDMRISINGKMKGLFGERANMTIAQLEYAFRWLTDTYGARQ